MMPFGAVASGLPGLAAGLLIVQTPRQGSGTAVKQMLRWAAIGSAPAVALVVAPVMGLSPVRWVARMDVVEAPRHG